MAVTSATWRPDSWRERRALQQPAWPDGDAAPAAVGSVEGAAAARLRRRGAALREQLAKVADRPRVPAPGGRLRRVVPRALADADPRAAEDPAADGGRAHLRRGAAGAEGRADRRPVREAALDRRSSSSTASEIPVFRGHMVHDDAPHRRARVPDPQRMLQGYHQSAATLNLLRAFTKGGFADLTQVHLWNQDFVAHSPEGRRYEVLASEIERALAFMAACGIDLAATPQLHEVDVLHEPRGAAARLRGGADAARLADRRLVRLLGAHALDRRAHAGARRRARRVLLPACTTRSASSSGPAATPRGGRRAVRAAQPAAGSPAG